MVPKELLRFRPNHCKLRKSAVERRRRVGWSAGSLAYNDPRLSPASGTGAKCAGDLYRCMSTNPTNADNLSWRNTEGEDAVRPNSAPGREALQALLAFSSLHAQIRSRRGSAHADPAETWETEAFVLDEVLQLVSERALHITGADGVAIALAEENLIVCRASAGRIAPEPGVRLDVNSGFSGACFRTGRIVRCDDAEYDLRVDAAMCRRLGTRSMVAVPLTTQGHVIGLLEAFSSEAYGFNDSDVRSLSLLAELILAALKPENEGHPDLALHPESPTEQPRSEVSFERRHPAAAVAEALIRAGEPPAREAAQSRKSDAAKAAPVASADAPSIQEVRTSLRRPQQEQEELEKTQATPPSSTPAVFLEYQQPPHSSRRGLLIALILLLFAASAAGGWWWNHQRTAARSAQKPVTPAAPPASPPAQQNQDAGPPSDTQPLPKAGVLPQVTGIRHWSSADSTTVAIDLQDQVQYEAHRLTDPERIYFDLHDTTLAANLPHDIEVGDALLVRIRIAQPMPDVTRVVLETKDSPNFSVSLEPNPYRLLIEIRSITAPPRAERKIDLFGPMDQYAHNTTHGAKAEQQQDKELASADPSGADHSRDRVGVPRFRIVLDAGHGGWDNGTVGRHGLMEKDLVLDITRRLGALISSRLDADVVYTRKDDTYISLERRTEIANLAQADMFLSVHANYSDYPSARGVETYYTNTYSSVRARTHDADGAQLTNVDWTNVDIRDKVVESRSFAWDVQKSLYGSLAARSPSLPNRGVKKAAFVVLTGTTMPAVLAEVSFVSSPTDETSLESSTYRERIAEALYKGVLTYARSLRGDNLASSVVKPVGQ